MAGWKTHQGTVVVLTRDNIDTDLLIPARFMSASRAEGYGQFLLHDLREGDADFPLDRHPDASVLLAGRNFGCGSSREAAVYALVDAGYRAVIATSFGDIFAGNAVNNGLLPARVSNSDAEAIAHLLTGTSASIEIDLSDRTVTLAEHTFPIDLPDRWRTKLINGWDDIDLTRAHLDEITAYRSERARNHSWAWPAHHSPGGFNAPDKQGPNGPDITQKDRQ